MFKEIITYFKTNLLTSKEARVFGHIYESISLIEREKRCHHHWLSHRSQCKNFILDNIHIAKKKSLLILGSGPLHEIPLEKLAQTFTSVDLVDIVHLKVTTSKYSHLPNVRFIEADITELEADLILTKKIMSKIPTQYINAGYDLVISANLLSQLAYHLRNFLEKKAQPKLSNDELDKFSNQVSLNHFLYLKNFHCPVLLITDIQSLFLDKNEQVVFFETPYIDFDLPKPCNEWWWEVAPLPEYSKDLSIKMKVAGFLLNQ